MSDIKVGDLVVVVKPRGCGCTINLGRVFRVLNFGIWNARCSACRHILPKIFMAEADEIYAFEPYRLKRIPPLEELEGKRTEEKLREPACS